MQYSSPKVLSFIVCSLLTAGCNHVTDPNKSIKNDTQSKNSIEKEIQLGSLANCQHYSGLPEKWLNVKTAGMVQLPSGSFNLGSDIAYPDEINFGQKQRSVKGFWIDRTEVTVAQFQSFIDATKYVTDAEKQNQAAVFSPNSASPHQWWQLKSGYTWRYPNGPKTPPAQSNEPVRFVTKNDAEHYALWLGRDLASEIEWEYAAKAGDSQDTPLHQAPLDHQHRPLANYWQGEFPFKNTKQDQFESVAPVGCFPPNAFGLYDQIGNVWEWTSSIYQGAHDQHMGNYQSLRQQQNKPQNFVIKGGSYLCANDYCARYRSSSRHPQELDLATSHVGFRTVLRP